MAIMNGAGRVLVMHEVSRAAVSSLRLVCLAAIMVKDGDPLSEAEDLAGEPADLRCC